LLYRPFGKSDFKASALGFGTMRLPTRSPDMKDVDEELTIAMIRYAIDSGVNYVDSAYPYHGGISEVVTGKALRDGYRDKVRLATKLPCWLVKEQGDFDRYLDEQLERLQTDHLDYYLLHSMKDYVWEHMQSLRVLDWAEKRMADGKFGGLGFSFHDRFEVFQQMLNDYPGWQVAQIYLNFMTAEQEAGLDGLRLAHERGTATVIMGPIWGGLLTKSLPSDLTAVYDSAPVKRKPAEWALAWLWNQPEVSVVLSGMSTMEQVVENVAWAEKYPAGSLTKQDLEVLEQVKAGYERLNPIACTDCGYCLPCASGVNIPRIFRTYNIAVAQNDLERQRFAYQNFIIAAQQADKCTQCGDCEEICPQHLPIREWLTKVHETLGKKPAS
jgi:hypothetical protein